MLETFAPKDIEGLSKLASVLTIPFFDAAAYVDFGLWPLGHDLHFYWFATSNFVWLSIPAKVIAFFFSVFAIVILFELIREPLINFPRFNFFVGFSLLAFGLLGLGELFPISTATDINIFWHLGCLCWGLDIFGAKNAVKP